MAAIVIAAMKDAMIRKAGAINTNGAINAIVCIVNAAAVNKMQPDQIMELVIAGTANKEHLLNSYPMSCNF